MKLKEREFLLEYFLNEGDRLAAEVARLQQNLRYRKINIDDCMELMLAADRLTFFGKLRDDLIDLLSMESFSELPELQYVSVNFDLIKKMFEKGE
jgi:hypothetical protein